MMKLLTAVALVLSPTPALAQTLSAEVSAGTNFRNDNISYGVGLGLDLPMTTNTIIGLEVSAEDFADDGDTTIFYGGARIGANVTDSTLLFVNGGYVHARSNSGYRLGGGLEQDLTSNVYTKLSYTYTDFGSNVNGHGGTIGLGLRF